MPELATTTEILQEIYDNLCRARDNTGTATIETVLDQVIEMVVHVSKQNQIEINLRNRLIASIQTV